MKLLLQCIYFTSLRGRHDGKYPTGGVVVQAGLRKRVECSQIIGLCCRNVRICNSTYVALFASVMNVIQVWHRSLLIVPCSATTIIFVRYHKVVVKTFRMNSKTLEKGQDQLSAYFDKSASTVGQVFNGWVPLFLNANVSCSIVALDQN